MFLRDGSAAPPGAPRASDGARDPHAALRPAMVGEAAIEPRPPGPEWGRERIPLELPLDRRLRNWRIITVTRARVHATGKRGPPSPLLREDP